MDVPNFRYIVALSLDTICLDGLRNNIINFSAIVYDLCGNNKAPIAKFHKYIRPTQIINEKIINLGIAIKDIEAASSLTKVLQNFDLWLKKELQKYDLVLPKMLKSKTQLDCAFVTWGNDIENILLPEIRYKYFEIPSYFNQWVNLKAIFINNTKYPNPDGNITLENAFEYLNLRFEGGHTSEDNILNLIKLAQKLYKSGGQIWINKDLKPMVKQNHFLSNQADC